MKSVDYPEPFRNLAKQLRCLPSVGPRSAERIALWLTTSKDSQAKELSSALIGAVENVRTCERCGFFSTGSACQICLDPARTGREICVVEAPTDILPIERTAAYRGSYHALGGRLSPLDNVGPEELRINNLLSRLKDEAPTEIILALSSDVEGEATANYLVNILRSTGIPITRIAQGLPAGGGLEQADQLTLQRALAGRRTYDS
ncbi:MAG: recombination mediator RecR [Chthoniobacterales bacterium]